MSKPLSESWTCWVCLGQRQRRQHVGTAPNESEAWRVVLRFAAVFAAPVFAVSASRQRAVRRRVLDLRRLAGGDW